MDYLLDLILIPMQVIIVIYTVYYFVLAVIGMWRSRVHKNYTPKNSFAIVVCAHNEEAVVGELVKNLKGLDYPDDLYDIFVVADNCTDKTAEVASAAGANVHECFNKEEVGKGYAMGWMFDRVDKMDRKYDAFLIFDADNLVHPQFMLEMNDHLEKGESVIQGYLNSKNPTDSWVAGTFSIAFWMVNHMWHLAKYRIGLSTALGGTGMCIRTSIIREYGWDCNSLTEDMEFSMKLLTHGLKTTWAHDAIVYDEKVTTMMASCKQRLRWAQGGAETILKYFPQVWRWRNRRLWPMYAEYFVTATWAILLVALVALALYRKITLGIGIQNMELFETIISIMFFSFFLQCLLSLYIDSRYEKGLIQYGISCIWYPYVYWLLNTITLLVGIPKAIFRNKSKLAVWTSPDRGV